MNRTHQTIAAALSLVLTAGAAVASDAATSAAVGGGFGRPGTAAATARYEGDFGLARTDTRTGRVNIARGLAVGVDEDGLAFSLSNAVLTPGGVSVATTLNIGIDRDGDVSTSTGLAIAAGPREREASAGGRVSTRPDGGGATSIAQGRSDRNGRVIARTHSDDDRPRRVVPRSARYRDSSEAPAESREPVLHPRPHAGVRILPRAK
jgi:hypothetical protein